MGEALSTRVSSSATIGLRASPSTIRPSLHSLVSHVSQAKPWDKMVSSAVMQFPLFDRKDATTEWDVDRD